MFYGLNEQVNTCKLCIILTGTLYKYTTATVAALTVDTTRRHFKSETSNVKLIPG